MKLVFATLLAVSAVAIPVARADDAMMAYWGCWASSATALLNGHGVSESTLVEAQNKADHDCFVQKTKAIASSGIYATDDAREHMETELYEANPISGTPVVQPEAPMTATAKFDPKSVDLYQPKNPNTVFNAGFAWLCEYPTDVGKFRNLMAAGEQQAAINIPGCIFINKPLEVVQTNSIGDRLIQVSRVTGSRTVDMWTEKDFFQDRNGWLVDECERSGINFNTCLDIVFDH